MPTGRPPSRPTQPAESGAPSTVERLTALPALARVPRPQLEWLVEHGQVDRLHDGGEIHGGPSMGLYVLIEGRFSVRVDQAGVDREVREVTPGRATGYLPYSRISAPRGYLVADGPVEFLLIPRDRIREMTRECYEFTASCVHEMLERVRVFKSDDKNQEKMAALGRLSAGLAHELNNPASAIARAANELNRIHGEIVEAALFLSRAGFDGDVERALASLDAATRRAPPRPLGPLERADLEDGIMEWLDDHGVDPSLAYSLAEHGVTVATLDETVYLLDAKRLAAVLKYVAAHTTARGLTGSIGTAAERIHSLVAAIKKHTHMDRAPTIEPIPVEDHLADTVALMRAKASLKGVALELTVDGPRPTVEGYVAELNQVWMHLLDNAIDAAAEPAAESTAELKTGTGPGSAAESGRVSIAIEQRDDAVVVRVIDDGPGIEPDDRERIFEPFFTTKSVGQGRGLGLDIVRTVVQRHGGTVDVLSAPGRTEFRVSLLAAGAPDGGAAGTGPEVPPGESQAAEPRM